MKPYLVVLIILSAFLLFFYLGYRPLLSSGEARASEIAVEMMQRGNLLIPYLNEEVLLTKPLLFHWIIILSYKLFGISEFGSRFPSSLAGLFVVVVVYFLGKRFWGKRAGFLSGMFLVTSPLFFWSARCARIDSLLLLLLTLSIYCFWRGHEDLPGGRLWFLGWFLFMSLGMLAKGPVGVIVPLAIAVIFLIYIKKAGSLGKLNWLWGLVLFFIIILPWFVAIYFLVPLQKAKLFFVQQNWAWLTGGGEWYKGYVYIPHLILGFFPYGLVLPAIFFYTWKDFKLKRDEKIVFLWLWIIIVFFIFCFFGKKVSRYILPLYPAVSLLTSYVISTRKNICWIFSFAWVVLWAFVVLAVILFGFYARFLDPEIVSIILRCINKTYLVIIGLVLVIFGLYGIKKNSISIPLAISFISLLMFIMFFVPIERDYYSPRPFCEMLKKEIPEGEVLKAYKSWDNTIRYYFGRHVDIINKEGELIEFLDSPGRVYCFMWKDVHKKLPQDIKRRMYILEDDYRIFERKVILVSNKE